MAEFIPKKLPTAESLGEKLRQTRSAKDLKVADIAKKINIRAEYLLALEEERWDDLPAGLYGKSFLKEYASFLGLKLHENFSPEKQALAAVPDNPFSQKIVKKNKFIIFPRLIKNILISLAVLVCFLYLIFYLKKIVWAPSLEITNPATNLPWPADVITVTGRTEKEAEVKINGEAVLNNNNGLFSQTINLKKGLNNIIITAKKKYSQEKTVTRQILAP